MSDCTKKEQAVWTALDAAEKLCEFYRTKDNSDPASVEQIRGQFRLALDKIMGEASFYAPVLAAIAFKQSEGDVYESVTLLRAFRASLQRKYYSEIIDVENMFIMRRISSSFKEIPGGQILGPTRDYTQRLLDAVLAEADTLETQNEFLKKFEDGIDKEKLEEYNTFSRVSDILRREGIMKPQLDDDRSVLDITRKPPLYPLPRSATLQTLARAETGGILTFGYAGMRGFGGAHGAVNELRVGNVAVRVPDPDGRVRYIGKITVTEASMSGSSRGRRSVGGNRKKSRPAMRIGYGLCFGQNETKAICMGMLDNGMRDESTGQAHKEFVLYHTEAADNSGFIRSMTNAFHSATEAEAFRVRSVIGRMRNTAEEKQAPLTEQNVLVKPFEVVQMTEGDFNDGDI